MWARTALPVAAYAYWRYPWRTNSYVHMPLWGVSALVMLAVQVGWWATLHAAFALPEGAIKLYQPGADAWWHSAWYILGGLAAAAAMWILQAAHFWPRFHQDLHHQKKSASQRREGPI